MTSNEPLSRQDMDLLLRFLPLFEAPDYAPVEAWAGVAGTPEGTITAFCPVYTAAVIEFFALVGRLCWSDEDYDPLTVGIMVLDSRFIARATLDEFKAMLAYCESGGRVHPRNWETLFNAGCVTDLLRRLAVLRAERRRRTRLESGSVRQKP